MTAAFTWDIFCKVIDNHGDIGVCWRLARDLAGRGHAVRLHASDASALQWMAPGGGAGVQVLPWQARHDEPQAEPADVVVEAFGCELDPAFKHRMAARRPAPVWINLEYLSAEDYALRSHALASPQLRGAAAGLGKWFYYPGFELASGGLLREPDLPARQAAFSRTDWLRRHAPCWRGERLVSLFCYEPAALGALLRQWAGGAVPTRLLVTAGRAAAAVRAVLPHLTPAAAAGGAASAAPAAPAGATGIGRLTIDWLPPLSQSDFDHLLWACDLNFVRGEDSLVRALWAGKPLVWQLYPQHDDAHHAKLAAFLRWFDGPASWAAWLRRWNGIDDARSPAAGPGSRAPDMADGWPSDLAAWQTSARQARARLLAQDDLCTRLIRFAAEKS